METAKGKTTVPTYRKKNGKPNDLEGEGKNRFVNIAVYTCYRNERVSIKKPENVALFVSACVFVDIKGLLSI